MGAAVCQAQEEGYQAALACDGEWIDSTQVRVEVCKSGGATPKRKARDNGADASGRGAHQDRRHSGHAPKVARPACQLSAHASCFVLVWSWFGAHASQQRCGCNTPPCVI